MEKIACGVIGATGMVGQNYIRLLERHPWLEVRYVAASNRSAGKRYAEAVRQRWLMESDIPENVSRLVVGNADDIESAMQHCRFIFSAVNMTKNQYIWSAFL